MEKGKTVLVIGSASNGSLEAARMLIEMAAEKHVIIATQPEFAIEAEKIRIPLKANPPFEDLQIKAQPAIFSGNPDRNFFKGQKRKNQRTKFR